MNWNDTTALFAEITHVIPFDNALFAEIVHVIPFDNRLSITWRVIIPVEYLNDILLELVSSVGSIFVRNIDEFS